MAKRKRTPNIEQQVIKFFHKHDRPVLIGEVAIAVHESIEMVEEMFEEFAERGIIRRLTHVEKDECGMYSIVDAYILEGKVCLKTAHDGA